MYTGFRAFVSFKDRRRTDYLRPVINKMSEEEFEIFIQYVDAISHREELMGASSHILDILSKK